MKRITKNKRRLRVLFVTSTFPRSATEVLAKWIGDLALHVQTKGIDVEILAPAHRGQASHDYKGIQVHRFRYAPARLETLTQDEGALMKIRRNPAYLLIVPWYLICGSLAVMDVVWRKKYDILHIHWPFPNALLTSLVRLRYSGKIILSFYGAEFSLMRKIPFGKLIMQKLLRTADAITADSTYTAKLIKDIVKEAEVSIIPLGVASSLRSKSPNQPVPSNRKVKKILFVGRLIERKGIAYLLAALPEIVKQVEAHLTIVGDGPLRNTLIEQSRSLGMTERVTFTGLIDDNALQMYYRTCDVFVLPAIHDVLGDTEGLGVVLLEAMSFGKPVVASRVGGIVDIVIPGKTGILVPEKDSVQLAKAIIKVLENNIFAQKIAKTGRIFIRKMFSWESIFKKLGGIYGEVMSTAHL